MKKPYFKNNSIWLLNLANEEKNGIKDASFHILDLNFAWQWMAVPSPVTGNTRERAAFVHHRNFSLELMSFKKAMEWKYEFRSPRR